MTLDSSEFCSPELPKSSGIVFTPTPSLDIGERDGKDESLCMFMVSTPSLDEPMLFLLVEAGFVFVVLSNIGSLLSTEISSVDRSSAPALFLLLHSQVLGSNFPNEVGDVILFPRDECTKARTMKSKNRFNIVEVEIQKPLGNKEVSILCYFAL